MAKSFYNSHHHDSDNDSRIEYPEELANTAGHHVYDPEHSLLYPTAFVSFSNEQKIIDESLIGQ